MGTPTPSNSSDFSEKKFAINHSELCFLEILKILEKQCDHTPQVKNAIGSLKSTYAEVQQAIISDFSENPAPFSDFSTQKRDLLESSN